MVEALLKDSKTFFILILISFFLIFTDSIGSLNFPKSAFQYITLPIQYGLYKTSISFFKQFEFIFLARRAVYENSALHTQMTQILSENATLRKKLSENEAILAQQNSLSPQTFTLVASRPIGVSRYLFIDKGLNDGLKKDMAVIFKDNYIGKIKEVTPGRSSVMLSTDPDSKISAFAQSGEGKAKGILNGQFEQEMLFDKVLHEESLKSGDLIYSEGSELEIPKGLILGQVSEVDSRDNEVFKQAKVKTVFSLEDLDVVFVVTN